jgi:hypothetical protein
LKPSKELGADNASIYRDWLGLDEAEYCRLHESEAF